MTISAATLRRLDIAAPLDLVRRLATLAAEATPEAMRDLPRAILLLASGQSVAGRVLRFDPHAEVRADDAILLHCDGAPTAAEICYVPAGQVVAVSISYPEAHLPHFSSGRIRASDTVPGRLVIERQARDMSERWTALLGLALALDWSDGDGDDHRLMMSDTIAALDAAVRAWADDATARSATAGRIDRIVVGFGAERQVALSERKLAITLGKRAGELFGFGAAELRREIERRL